MTPDTIAKNTNDTPCKDYDANLASNSDEQTTLDFVRRTICVQCEKPIPESRQRRGYPTCSKECTQFRYEAGLKPPMEYFERCIWCGDPISEKRQRLHAKFCKRPKECAYQHTAHKREIEKVKSRAGKRAELEIQAMEFLDETPEFIGLCIQRIDKALGRGIQSKWLSIRWVCEDIRVFEGIKFRNEWLPYIARFIVERNPTYEKLFKLKE